MSREFISHAASAETLALGTEAFALLADGARTNGQLTCVEVWVPPGGGPPLHRHALEDEAFYVLEGALPLEVEGRSWPVPAGSFAWAPRNLRHRFTNATKTAVRMVVFMLPAGIEDAFRAASPGLAPGTRAAPAQDPGLLARFFDACGSRGIDLDPVADAPAAGTTPYVASLETAEAISLVGDVYSLLATGQTTGGALYLHDAMVPPGGGPPPHSHVREDEAFYVISGTLTLEIEGKRLLAPAGSFVWAPRGQVHRFFNGSDAPVRCLVLALPAGFERMVRAAGTPVPPGTTTPVPPTPGNQAIPSRNGGPPTRGDSTTGSAR